MPYVKFVKTKTKAEALASNDSGAIYFPTDANTIIMENKEYGINSCGPSDNDNSGIPEAPIDGKPYNRKDGEWVEASGESTVFQGEFNPDECLTPGVYSYVKGELVDKDPNTQYVLSVSEDKTQKASPMNAIDYCYVRYYNGESDSEDDPFEMYRPVGEPIELDVFSAIGQQFNANDNLHFYYEYDEDTVIESEYCVLEVFRCDRFILPDNEIIYAILDIVGFSEDTGVPIITPKVVLVEYDGEYMLMDTSNIGTPVDSVVLHPDGSTSVTVTKDTAIMLAQQFDTYLQVFNGESAFTPWEYYDTGSSEPTGDYVTHDELNEYAEQVTNEFDNTHEYIDGAYDMCYYQEYFLDTHVPKSNIITTSNIKTSVSVERERTNNGYEDRNKIEQPTHPVLFNNNQFYVKYSYSPDSWHDYTNQEIGQISRMIDFDYDGCSYSPTTNNDYTWFWFKVPKNFEFSLGVNMHVAQFIVSEGTKTQEEPEYAVVGSQNDFYFRIYSAFDHTTQEAEFDIRVKNNTAWYLNYKYDCLFVFVLARPYSSSVPSSITCYKYNSLHNVKLLNTDEYGDAVRYSNIDSEFIPNRSQLDYTQYPNALSRFIDSKTTIKNQFRDWWSAIQIPDNYHYTQALELNRENYFFRYFDTTLSGTETGFCSDYIYLHDNLVSDDGEYELGAPRIDMFFNRTPDRKLDESENTIYISVPINESGTYRLIASAYLSHDDWEMHYRLFGTFNDVSEYTYDASYYGDPIQVTINFHDVFDEYTWSTWYYFSQEYGQENNVFYYTPSYINIQGYRIRYSAELFGYDSNYNKFVSNEWFCLSLYKGEAISKELLQGEYGLRSDWIIVDSTSITNVQQKLEWPDSRKIRTKQEAMRLFQCDDSCVGYELLALEDFTILLHKRFDENITKRDYGSDNFAKLATAKSVIEYTMVDIDNSQQIAISSGLGFDKPVVYVKHYGYYADEKWTAFSDAPKTMEMRGTLFDVHRIMHRTDYLECDYVVTYQNEYYVKFIIQKRYSEPNRGYYYTIKNNKNKIVKNREGGLEYKIYDDLDIFVYDNFPYLKIEEIIDTVESLFAVESMYISESTCTVKSIDIYDLVFGNGYFNNNYYSPYEICLRIRQESWTELFDPMMTQKMSQGNHKTFFAKYTSSPSSITPSIKDTTAQIRMDYLYIQETNFSDDVDVYIILSDFTTSSHKTYYSMTFRGHAIAYMHGTIRNGQYEIDEVYEMRGVGRECGLLDHSGDKSLLTNLVDSEGDVWYINVQKLKRLVIRQLDPIVDFDTV